MNNTSLSIVHVTFRSEISVEAEQIYLNPLFHVMLYVTTRFGPSITKPESTDFQEYVGLGLPSAEQTITSPS